MKNIHLIPTDKPSRLGYLTKKGKEEFKDLRFFDVFMPTILDGENQNIYITNDEEINDGDWCFHSNQKSLIQIGNNEGKLMKGHIYLKKIILTTDQDLINDGVQNIENEFLEWFVNNSSCEFVEVEKTMYMPFDGKVAFELSLDESLNTRPYYKIIIPKEEPKQLIGERVMPLDNKDIPEEEPEQDKWEQLRGLGLDKPLTSWDEIKQHVEFINDNIDEFDKAAIEYFKRKSKFKQDLNDAMHEAHQTGSAMKQETIEEILLQKIKELDSCNLPGSFQGGYANGFVNGAKWQAERMYTEDDFKLFARQYYREIKLDKSNLLWDNLADKCLEEFKNK